MRRRRQGETTIYRDVTSTHPHPRPRTQRRRPWTSTTRTISTTRTTRTISTLVTVTHRDRPLIDTRNNTGAYPRGGRDGDGSSTVLVPFFLQVCRCVVGVVNGDWV